MLRYNITKRDSTSAVKPALIDLSPPARQARAGTQGYRPVSKPGLAPRLVALLLAGLLAGLAILPASAQDKADRLKVVATFSILGDLARNVGGDRADVVTLVGPNSDIHVYTPTAGDAQSVRNARLLIV